MRIASLGSGSRGNATLIEDGNTCVLIDLGFSVKETVSRLRRLGREPEDVHAILVTHEHADHIHGVAPFARKFNTAVYMTPGTGHARKPGRIPELHAVNCHRGFRVGSLGIEPVPVPHDAKEPCQYIVSSKGKRVGVLTDLGHISRYVAERYRECDAMLLECNHDLELLEQGPYPWSLKQRVGGIHGHLNNLQSAELVTELELGRLQHLILCHISEQNNRPELAVDAMEPALDSWSGEMHVARQECGFDWIEVG